MCSAGHLCRGICTAPSGQGLRPDPGNASASFQLHEFLAPHVKEFAVSGSHSFSVLSGFHEPCFDSAGKKGREVMLDCLVSPCCFCNRFSLSLAGFEINPKAGMIWRVCLIPVSGAVQKHHLVSHLCSIFCPTFTHGYPQPLLTPFSCG